MLAHVIVLPLILGLSAAMLAEAETVAVLPFANLTSPSAFAGTAASPASSTADPASGPPAAANLVLSPASLDWIGESIAETLREAIGSRGLTTHAREETADAFQRLNLKSGNLLTHASVLKVGESLDAEHVIYGAFLYTPATNQNGLASPSSLKITALVLDRRRLRQGPEFLETGNLDDLPSLEAHLAWRALEFIAPKLAPPESEYRTLRMQVRLDAQESYIRGLLSRMPEQREKLMLQAARLDARFTSPMLQLGRTYLEQKEYRKASEWLQKVPDADSHFHEASFLLGLALLQSGDAPGAEKAFQAVADAVPLSEVWNNLGVAQSRRSAAQAADSFRRALEGDPNDPSYHFNLGYALWKKGDFSVAADRFRAVLDRQPDDQWATLLLGMCLKKQAPRPTDSRLQGIERLKTNYEEHAYLQLKSMVEPSK